MEENTKPNETQKGQKGGFVNTKNDNLPDVFTTEEGIVQVSEEESEDLNGS